MLAPKSEVSIYPWKEPPERIPIAVRQVRSLSCARIGRLEMRRAAGRVGGAEAAAQLPSRRAKHDHGADRSGVIGGDIEVAWQGAAEARDFITIRAERHPRRGATCRISTRPRLPSRSKRRSNPAATSALSRGGVAVPDACARADHGYRRHRDADGARDGAAGEEFTFQWTGPNNEREVHRSRESRRGRRHVQRPVRLHAQGLAVEAARARCGGRVRAALHDGGHTVSHARPRSRASDEHLGHGQRAGERRLPALRSRFSGRGRTTRATSSRSCRSTTAAREYDAYVYTYYRQPRVARGARGARARTRCVISPRRPTRRSRRLPLTVTPVSATLEAPPSAPARAIVNVTWEGPGNPTDYIILAAGRREQR